MMRDPMPINLKTSEQIRSAGWQAESRDADGHLISTYSHFENDFEIVWFVREETGRGNTVTVWPPKETP